MNDKLHIISKNQPFSGKVSISGSKNASLPILAAAILSNNPMHLSNVPMLADVSTMLQLLGCMGVTTLIKEDMSLCLNASNITSTRAPYHLVKMMRASFLVLGPLLGRFGQAEVSLPGGCAIGIRPIDLHLKAFEQMGASIETEGGYLKVSAKGGRLKGASISLDIPTVTGTENILMAAVLAQGETVIKNVALEPEIIDLCICLKKMGAIIEGEGTSTIKIQGVDALNGVKHAVIPDRIEAGTFLIASAATRGKIHLKNVQAQDLSSLLTLLKKAGAEIYEDSEGLYLDMKGNRPKSVSFETDFYPGFPTDLQAQMVVLNSVAEGTSVVTENIFKNRFMHIAELKRMNAKIHQINDRSVSIEGIDALSPATVSATDLRASFSLIIAACVASGETIIESIDHLDRGYSYVEEKLNALGVTAYRKPGTSSC